MHSSLYPAAAADDDDDGDDAGILCRTHTLLLVAKSGHCEYVEMTLNTDVMNTNHSLSANHSASVNGIRSSDWLTTQVDFIFA